MGAPRGCRSQRIEQAREAYASALNAWLADPRREYDGERPSSELMFNACLELLDALQEAGVGCRSRPATRIVD